MRMQLLIALALLAPGGAQERGAVASVSAAIAPAGEPTVFRLSGDNPCASVRVDYGDGTTQLLPIQGFPTQIRHTYTRPGTYQLRARGVSGCRGLAAMTVRVPQSGVRPGGRPEMRARFLAMDANADGRISRQEWRGSGEAFRVHDWNGDGVLSGDEVGTGAAWPRMPDIDAPNRPWHDDWTPERFARLDVDRDRRLTSEEWPYDQNAFDRVDRNHDGAISQDEFVGQTSSPIVVRPTERWTDTGIVVRTGDLITFNATGTIELSGEKGDPADPTGSRTGRRAPEAPLPDEPAGILLARIGTGDPIAVGRTNRLRATDDGRLYLGVNDDQLTDNRGAFRVFVTVER